MRALTWHGNLDVRVTDVPDPRIQEPNDAVIAVTSTAICGSDLHLYGVLGPYLSPGDVLRDQVARLTDGARELLAQLPPPSALRRWMDLFGDWIATKNGMLDTLLAMIESGEIPHAQTQVELLAAIDEILDAGRVTGELRADVTAEDIAASLIGVFTVARPPEHDARASRLLNILMDGLRSRP